MIIGGYRGSTPIPQEEVTRWTSPDVSIKDLELSFAIRARELSRFLVTFIQENGIQDIALIGHSLGTPNPSLIGSFNIALPGNQTTAAFLAYSDQLPENEYAILKKHFKTLFLYGEQYTHNKRTSLTSCRSTVKCLLLAIC